MFSHAAAVVLNTYQALFGSPRACGEQSYCNFAGIWGVFTSCSQRVINELGQSIYKGMSALQIKKEKVITLGNFRFDRHLFLENQSLATCAAKYS